MDPKNKPGSHWISVYLSFKTAEYFDPLGLPPNLIIVKKFKNNFFKYSSKIIQNPFSPFCGLYCMYYILQKSKKRSLKYILKEFKNNVIFNDKKIKKLIIKHF